MSLPLPGAAPPPDEEESPRRTFVRAFAGNAWRRPNPDRMHARPVSTVMMAVVACGLAMLVGVVWGVIRPARPTAAAPERRSTDPATFTALAGWDCAGTDHSGFEAVGRTPQWYTVATGGWAADGCRGTFAALPMSGRAGAEDPDQYVTWWFATGATVTRCAVAVYLPVGAKPADAAATAARYDVLAGRSGTAYAAFTVDQTARPGRWQDAGTFPVSGGLALRLGNRGVPARPGAMIAVAQVKVDCRV
ncbi:hypothetical protein [Dactylosporangium sp. CA-092794]|uniref:hypothetical protein n=1 Tax=Dactylosporangium sp. CA-092794 TaxID=3239929 RepID=UPI003D8AE24E